MRAYLLPLTGLTLLFAGFQTYAIPPNPQNPQIPNLQIKEGALKGGVPRVLPFSTTGVIHEMLCEDHEVMIVDSQGHEFRVFPTVSIAGHAINSNADIVRFCRANLCSDQTIRVRGERSEVNGRTVIGRASITPVTHCR